MPTTQNTPTYTFDVFGDKLALAIAGRMMNVGAPLTITYSYGSHFILTSDSPWLADFARQYGARPVAS